MKKNKARCALFGLLVVSLVMTGCLGINKKPEPIQFGDLAGVVKYTDGTPIAGAEVSIGSITAVTDENGVFGLEQVPYGNHTLVVREPLGYVSSHTCR